MLQFERTYIWLWDVSQCLQQVSMFFVLAIQLVDYFRAIWSPIFVVTDNKTYS